MIREKFIDRLRKKYQQGGVRKYHEGGANEVPFDINTYDPNNPPEDHMQLPHHTGGDTENVGDSALDQAISDASATQNVTTVAFANAANDVTFTSSWGSSDVTGQSISEVALYSDQDDFIARKTFSSFSKTNAFTFQIEWTLRF